MSDNNPITNLKDEEPLFAARLTPHRSLPRNGFVLLMLLIGGLTISTGLMFLAIGAWPIVAFLILDVTIVFLAFHLSYRSGRAYEEVTVTPDLLTIRRVSPWGRVSVDQLHPVWTRLKTAYDEEEERVLAIKLESKGKQVPVGAFMNPDDKESFANALGEVLARLKRGAPA
ncbi:DUF2244 domain-containing protein [Ahrensia marina]|uniref:DUF2244 domain-containing protein n=1 Tax=Ahrensia marina TaxID=1514904 RepID=UPI0035D02666